MVGSQEDQKEKRKLLDAGSKMSDKLKFFKHSGHGKSACTQSIEFQTTCSNITGIQAQGTIQEDIKEPFVQSGTDSDLQYNGESNEG